MSVRVLSLDYVYRWQVQVSVYCTRRIIAHPVAPYRYLLPTVYLFVADIVNLELFSCVTWICLNITRFYEEQCQPSSGAVWPTCQKWQIGSPLLVSTQFAQQSCRLCELELNSLPHSIHP